MCSCIEQKHEEHLKQCCQDSKGSSTTAREESCTSDGLTKYEMKTYGKEPIAIQIKGGNDMDKPHTAKTKAALQDRHLNETIKEKETEEDQETPGAKTHNLK